MKGSYHSWAAITLLFVILVAWVGGTQSMQSTHPDDLDCTAQPIEEIQLSSNAGRLLYHHGGTVNQVFYDMSSTDDLFKADVEDNIYQTRISPDGLWIASLQVKDEKILLVTRSSKGEIIFSMYPENQYMRDVMWLNNEEFLTLVGNPDRKTYAEAIINPFSGEVKYVYPTLPRDNDLRSKPLFDGPIAEGGYWFSPDGRYLSGDHLPGIYDFAKQEFLDRNGFRGAEFLSDYPTDRLIKVDRPYWRQAGIVTISIYDISESRLWPVASFGRKREEFIEPDRGSWSPDDELLALVRSFYGLEILSEIELLHLPTQHLIETCLINYQVMKELSNTDEKYLDNILSPQFAWSRDGRYLALYGLLKTEFGQRETGSVYLYDTVDGQVYEVYRGWAGIVGWAAAPS